MKCSIACNGGRNVHVGPTRPNISSAGTQGQKELEVENRKEEAKESQRGSKRQRKETVGKLVKSRK